MQIIISSEKYEDLVKSMNVRYDDISDDGCFFSIFSTEYDNEGNVLYDLYDVIAEGINIGYSYVNTIVYPTKEVQKVFFRDNVKYVIWLCKDSKKMKFNKDHIREKHIWKDVEWGKREKNYNIKGKDPGNVWIPTEDDGHANITKHILLSDEDVINRIIAMTEAEKDYELITPKKELMQIENNGKNILKENTSKNKCYGEVIFGTAEKMEEIEDNSISVAITSPPYWDLKDYFKKGQIGQETYTKYITRISVVWEQCYRKLKNDGSLFININIRQKNGNVILIPYDVVKQCKKIGFIYKGILLWHKSSGIPTGEKNLVDRHEYVLIFVKSDDAYFDYEKLKNISDYKNNDINGGAFWNINRKAGSVGKKYIHPAIYPNDLVKRIILATTNPGDVILDPFLGSGTTLISALQTERSFIGYEYNEGFKELMNSRFTSELKSTDNLSYIKQK